LSQVIFPLFDRFKSGIGQQGTATDCTGVLDALTLKYSPMQYCLLLAHNALSVITIRRDGMNSALNFGIRSLNLGENSTAPK